MELILISESKLKVILTAGDMRQYDITCESFDCADVHSRTAFRRILNEARAGTGFDAVGDKVFVQVYPSKEGGCEMFVTKLARGGITEGEDEMTGTAQTAQTRGATGEKPRIIYSFDEMKHLMCACRSLAAAGYAGESTAYGEASRRFFLMTEKDSPIIAEEGGVKCRPQMSYYISEHCGFVCHDAVTVLGKLA